ncbi:hypothetical protein [Halomonas faecis]|uniref:hypothetical protein n=1 Tax=Halomonas faecis TaxID=1562110 RepID=UPI0013D1A572|nr:hypothetical protein [Halomonas faecis]
MIWHLIAALFAGLGAAGIGLLLRTLSGKRLPRWIIPVCAGLGMLGYQIQTEYAWFEHKQQQLPPSAEVVSSREEAMVWRPWTFLVPMTTSFHVIDHDNRVVRETDDQRLVEFILYRFDKEYVDQVSHQAHLMNCSSRELVPLAGDNREPRTEQMRRLDEDDALFKAACADQ